MAKRQSHLAEHQPIARVEPNTHPHLFISYWNEELPTVKRLDTFFKEYIPGITTFYSKKIPAGDKWYEEHIEPKLNQCGAVITLLSPQSAERLWIGIETGLATAVHKKIIPVLHRGLTSGDAPFPFKTLQAKSLTCPNELTELIFDVATHLGLQHTIKTNSEDIEPSIEKWSSEFHNIGTHQNRSADESRIPSHSAVRIHLVGNAKHQTLEHVTQVENGRATVFHIQDLGELLSNLWESGLPHSHVVNIDEHWANYLCKRGRLLHIEALDSDSKHIPTLMQSYRVDNKSFAAPHFLDFSIYSHQKDIPHSPIIDILYNLRRDILKPVNPEEFEATRKKSGFDHLLAYDTHTPNTVAAVMLEFIDSYGCGIPTIGTPRMATDESLIMNSRAITVLRALSGLKRHSDVAEGRTLDLNNLSSKSLMFRHWHSMLSDEEAVKRRVRFLWDSSEAPAKGTLGGWGLAILAGSPNPDNALALIRTLTSPERQKARFDQGGGLPTLLDSYRSPSQDRSTAADWTTIIEYIEQRLVKRSQVRCYTNGVMAQLVEWHNEVVTSEKGAESEFGFAVAKRHSEAIVSICNKSA